MLRVRWLGRVPYREAYSLQRGLWEHGVEDHLLLLEHDHVFTLGVRADPAHVLVPAASVGADLVRTDRGGDVTYHGPGQLVGYPVVAVPMGPDAVPRHVAALEQLLIDVLADAGLPGTGRLPGYPGVWVSPDGEPRKIAAIGVRVSRGRSMHGFALNVDPGLEWFDRIIPCGIREYRVTSLRAEGVRASMAELADAIASRAPLYMGSGGPHERQAVVERRGVGGARPAGARPPTDDLPRRPPAAETTTGAATSGLASRPLGVRLASAGVDVHAGLALEARKPEWLRLKARMGPEYRQLQATVRNLRLVTVCEEAGCPNIFECWAEGTATFMINGARCTRACGFCMVDTSHPGPLDPQEPERVAEAVARMGLGHAVVTAVARDDLPDGGAATFAATIGALRSRRPGISVEVLVPDFRGDAGALAVVTSARPDVLNHNLETVARLQRAVRPSAGYARSLALLARGKGEGLVTKSGIIVGMGEREEEVLGALADLRGVGVDIVTIGQYLRPSARHLPVARWWSPDELDGLRRAGEAMGFAHVQASPLTRSSYHARAAVTAARAACGSGLGNAS